MTTSTELLFDVPNRSIASEIKKEIADCSEFYFVIGFATEGGLAMIENEIKGNPMKLKTIVIGAGTLRAYEALDELTKIGVPMDRLMVDLGYSRKSFSKHPFIQFHPMLHSKIYYFKKTDGTSTLLVGSHNLTVHALGGQNGEATIRVKGDTSDTIFKDIESYILNCQMQATQYDPSMKTAYAWWARQYFEGLRWKILYATGEKDIEFKRTILIFSAQEPLGRMPGLGDIIYLEVPEAFRVLESLGDQVHLYLTSQIPNTPLEAIANVNILRNAFALEVTGTNIEQVERGRADWVIRDITKPILEPAPYPFDLTPRSSFVQVFVKIKGPLKDRYEYKFNYGNHYAPLFDGENEIALGDEEALMLKQLNLIPPEDKPWQKVTDLIPVDGFENKTPYIRNMLKLMLPESGNFVTYSNARKKISKD